MRQTSLEAYTSVRKRLGERQAAVLEALRQQGFATDKQLAQILSWPINCTTPRRGELVKAGMVREAGLTYDSGRPHTLWMVTEA